MYALKTLLPLVPAFALAQQYSLTETGGRNTEDWRIHLKIDGEPASFWHDVPLYPDPSNATVVNFVVEIPRWEDAKIELKRDEPGTPIFHDTNDDGVRFVESVFPHKSYPFLYGSIPQTWENPNLNHSFTGFPGDDDPVDAFDIGQDVGYIGQVKQVKIIGGLALIDGDETDWKMLVIDVNDSLASKINSIEDLKVERPGVAEAWELWFRTYKIPRGDGLLNFTGDTYQNASFVSDIIVESHEWWKELIAGEAEDSNDINFNQTTMSNVSASYVAPENAFEELNITEFSTFGEAARKPERFTHWYYVDAEEGTLLE